MANPVKAEVQLGHLCNDRCVFCISGHLTSAGKAPLLDPADILRRLDKLYARGIRDLTLLGGEPTIQPYFLDVIQHAVKLGFSPIVIFSNGSRVWKPEIMDAILATGGAFEWRFSFQGATEEAHERTTRRRGSFTQTCKAVQAAHDRGQRITLNTCVVKQNFASLPAFAELLAPWEVAHLHLDMMHPEDTPTEFGRDELTEMIPRYSALRAPLAELHHKLEGRIDFNVGNLPFCVAPELSSVIRHGGQPTETSTVNIQGRRHLDLHWDKYAHKRGNKVKDAGCSECVFDAECTGFFAAYVDLYGLDECRPIKDRPTAPSRPPPPLTSGRTRLAILETSECNSRCRFCAHPPAATLTPAKIPEVDPHHAGITFTGGEPTLSAALGERIAKAKMAGWQSIGVQTNAQRSPDEAQLRSLVARGLTEVHLSIHGSNAAAHDFHTGIEGSHQGVQRWLTQARALDLKVFVATVVTRSNYRDLDQLSEGLRTRGVAGWCLEVPEHAGRAGADFLGLHPRLGVAMPHLLRALHHGRSAGLPSFVRGAPLCTLGPYAAAALPSRPRAYAQACEGCPSRPRCPGVAGPYIERFGGMELHPKETRDVTPPDPVSGSFVGPGKLAAPIEPTL